MINLEQEIKQILRQGSRFLNNIEIESMTKKLIEVVEKERLIEKQMRDSNIPRPF
jgi:nickel-dependent lactate racemase